MALNPIDGIHALQIQAGTIGRKAGHAFEDTITNEINSFNYPFTPSKLEGTHVRCGNPALLLLSAIAQGEGVVTVTKAVALSTGALATSEEGKSWLNVNGVAVNRCKSDLVLTLHTDDGRILTVGVSTKQCNNANPTNAQLYFTTATAFAALLQANGISVSEKAVIALKEFCGDVGFRPSDSEATLQGRLSDPRRYFWEEIDPSGRKEWELLFGTKQNDITRLLLQKAYLNDPFVPTYVLHKTKKTAAWKTTEVAIYSVDDLISLSAAYQGFATKAYSVKKGSHKDPTGVSHLAPRFGIIQMQRGGQAQHPTQLQFNLEAGYFYKIEQS
jgi:hypothetical protein